RGHLPVGRVAGRGGARPTGRERAHRSLPHNPPPSSRPAPGADPPSGRRDRAAPAGRKSSIPAARPAPGPGHLLPSTLPASAFATQTPHIHRSSLFVARVASPVANGRKDEPNGLPAACLVLRPGKTNPRPSAPRATAHHGGKNEPK